MVSQNEKVCGIFFPACCGGNSLQLVSSKGDSGHHFSSAKRENGMQKKKKGAKRTMQVKF